MYHTLHCCHVAKLTRCLLWQDHLAQLHILRSGRRAQRPGQGTGVDKPTTQCAAREQGGPRNSASPSRCAR